MIRYLLITATVLGTLVFRTLPVFGGGNSLLELKVGDTAYQGKLLARSKTKCWLVDRSGFLRTLDLQEIDSFRRVSSRFTSQSSTELRAALQRELGKNFEVSISQHYVVCAPRGRASEYSHLFEDVYRRFRLHFSVRGFSIAEPEFPLIAITLPNEKAFRDYCNHVGMNVPRGVVGYYLCTSNRVALYDTGRRTLAASNSSRLPKATIWSALSKQTDVQNTIIHEATHQIAFNTGLHSRLGQNPTWLVEGLATVFEAPGIRHSSRSQSVKDRLNMERLTRFREYMKRRKTGSLTGFVSTDLLFQVAPLDAYSQAWALTFYLIETHPREYVQLLKTIAARDVLAQYTAGERLRDFKKAFGSDLAQTEADFLRFIKRLD